MATQQFDRTDRIASLMQRELERIIREEVSDPRTDCLFSVTQVEVTRDLRYAKAYVSVYREEDRKPMLDALKKAAGFIRHLLGERIQLRYTPELVFVQDSSIEYGVRMAKLIDEVKRREEAGHEEQPERLD